MRTANTYTREMSRIYTLRSYGNAHASARKSARKHSLSGQKKHLRRSVSRPFNRRPARSSRALPRYGSHEARIVAHVRRVRNLVLRLGQRAAVGDGRRQAATAQRLRNEAGLDDL